MRRQTYTQKQTFKDRHVYPEIDTDKHRHLQV